VAELIGADADSERAICWLILMMVLCCDPLATASTDRGFGTGINHGQIAGKGRIMREAPARYSTFLHRF